MRWFPPFVLIKTGLTGRPLTGSSMKRRPTGSLHRGITLHKYEKIATCYVLELEHHSRYLYHQPYKPPDPWVRSNPSVPLLPLLTSFSIVAQHPDLCVTPDLCCSSGSSCNPNLRCVVSSHCHSHTNMICSQFWAWLITLAELKSTLCVLSLQSRIPNSIWRSYAFNQNLTEIGAFKARHYTTVRAWILRLSCLRCSLIIQLKLSANFSSHSSVSNMFFWSTLGCFNSSLIPSY